MEDCICNYSSTEKDFTYTHNMADIPRSYPVHIHDMYELYYFISGDVTYYIEGQNYIINSNDILIINSRELHKPVFNSTKPYERIVIHFNPRYISSFQTKQYNLLHYFENRKLGHHNKINSTQVLAKNIKKYIDEIENNINKNIPESPIMIKTLFIQLLITLNSLFVTNENIITNSFKYDEKVSSILEYINNNLSEKITLEILEHNFFVNKYYLCHIFKKTTSFTLIEYITYKRIMKAKELLIEGISVMEVCHKIGFNDYTNFYKVFKKLTGTSPKNFTKTAEIK